MSKKIFQLIGLFIFFTHGWGCQFAEEVVAKRKEALQVDALNQAIEALAKDTIVSTGAWAFSVRSAKTGEIVASYNANQSLNVASCMKTVTTMAGLEILGPDYVFATHLEYDGEIKNGILEGNLYIVGGGDPTLGSKIMGLDFDRVLDTWLEKIANLGIRKIHGSIVADETLFNENVTPDGWLWVDIGNYYGAPAMALNIFDNTYTAHFKPGNNLGDPTKIRKTTPFIPNLDIQNQVKTAGAGTGDQTNIFGAPYQDQRYADGTVPKGGEFLVKGSIPDPGMLCVSQLSERLKKIGFIITEKNTSSRLLKATGQEISKEGRKRFHSQFSPPLSEIVKWVNLYSVNLFAEAIIKTIGVGDTKLKETESGAKKILEYWKKKGVNTLGFYQLDGSGLSVQNGITANQLSQMLQICSKQPFFQSFYNSLPVAGVSGTMTGLCRNTKATNNLRAKTGGMTRVLSFAGYFTAQNGELMCFSLATNQYNGDYYQMQKKLEKIMNTMVE